MDLAGLSKFIHRDNISKIERFMLYAQDKSSTCKLSEDQQRTLAIAYHRLWWYRDQEIKKFFPKEEFEKYKSFVSTKYKLTIEQDLKQLLLSHTDQSGRLDYPALQKLFKLDITETLNFFATKENKVVNSAPSILYYDNNGNFWHGDKAKFCYPFSSKSKRFSILRYLIKNKGFQETESIWNETGGKNTQATRTEIRKIKLNIHKHLGLDDIILSNPPDGYGLNPKYQIVFEK